MVRKLIILALLALSTASFGSDTLRTVREFRYRIYSSGGFADTLNGNAEVDSNRMVGIISRAAARVGDRIGMPRCKSLSVTDGTASYLLDGHLSGIRAAALVKSNYWKPIAVVAPKKFGEGFFQEPLPTDTIINFCSIHGDSIYFQPAPRHSGTVKIWYWSRGKSLTAQSDTCDLPYELYPAVEYLASQEVARILQDELGIKSFGELYAVEEAYWRAQYGRND